MTAQCAECWRLYETTPDGVRRHQMLAGHRPAVVERAEARASETERGRR